MQVLGSKTEKWRGQQLSTSLFMTQRSHKRSYTLTHLQPPSLTLSMLPKPMAMVGAGRLTSMIWKNGDERTGWRYSFNLFRLTTHGGRVSQLFKPADVIHLVKLAQVLAAVIADDGCLTQIECGVLKRLATDLDEVLRDTPDNSEGFQDGEKRSPHAAASPKEGASNGETTHT